MVEHKKGTPESGSERHRISEKTEPQESSHLTKMQQEVQTAQRTGERPAARGDGKGDKHLDVTPVQDLTKGEKLKIDSKKSVEEHIKDGTFKKSDASDE